MNIKKKKYKSLNKKKVMLFISETLLDQQQLSVLP